MSKFKFVGKQMLINLENSREQYSVLGYPHRTEFILECSECKKRTLVDSNILYNFCPHCGAAMNEKDLWKGEKNE